MCPYTLCPHRPDVGMGRRPVVGPCTMAVDFRLLAELAPCMLAQSNWGWNMVSWLIELVSYWWADELDDWACAYCWKRACSTKEHTIWPSGSGKWDAHKFHSAQALTIKGQASWRCHECTICLFFIAATITICLCFMYLGVDVLCYVFMSWCVMC